jgi:hypothetical protein
MYLYYLRRCHLAQAVHNIDGTIFIISNSWSCSLKLQLILPLLNVSSSSYNCLEQLIDMVIISISINVSAQSEKRRFFIIFTCLLRPRSPLLLAELADSAPQALDPQPQPRYGWVVPFCWCSRGGRRRWVIIIYFFCVRVVDACSRCSI